MFHFSLWLKLNSFFSYILFSAGNLIRLFKFITVILNGSLKIKSDFFCRLRQLKHFFQFCQFCETIFKFFQKSGNVANSRWMGSCGSHLCYYEVLHTETDMCLASIKRLSKFIAYCRSFKKSGRKKGSSVAHSRTSLLFREVFYLP